MADETVWRMILGDAARGCDYDCDVEIAVYDGPETRQKRNMKLTFQLYSYVLIFNHKKDPEVRYLILNKQELEDLETLCLTVEDKPRLSVGRFSLRKQGEKHVFTLTSEQGNFSSLLIKDGIERIIASVRVKGHLDRYSRNHLNNDREFNLMRERDLTIAVNHLTTKYAVDVMDSSEDSFPKLMPENRYKDIITMFSLDGLRTAYRVDCATMTKSVMATLGMQWRLRPRVMDYYLAQMKSMYNPYNQPLRSMTEEQLLVLGTWMLRME